MSNAKAFHYLIKRLGPETIDASIIDVPEGTELKLEYGKYYCLFPDGRWMSNDQLQRNLEVKREAYRRRHDLGWLADWSGIDLDS